MDGEEVLMSVMTGGCQCGAVRYEIAGAPVATYVCHCRECRKQSASAFGISVIVRVGDFHLKQGATKSWTRGTDSGARLKCVFCPECGSRLWHEGEPKGPTISVKGGALDEGADLSEARHIWVSRKLPGVVIPAGRPQFAEEPPRLPDEKW
jgi:hypothetical protein